MSAVKGRQSALKGKTYEEIYGSRLIEVKERHTQGNKRRGTGQDRASFKSQQFRQEVLTRDKSACRECGISQSDELEKTGLPLEAHHIKDWENFPELRYVVDNGLTLCRCCHRRLEEKIKKEKGFTESEETRRRKSESQKLRHKFHPHSQEVKDKIRQTEIETKRKKSDKITAA